MVAPTDAAAGVAALGGHRERAVAGPDLVEHRIAVVAGRDGLAGRDLHLPLALVAAVAGAGRGRANGWVCVREAARRCSCRCRPGYWRATAGVPWICCACVAIAARFCARYGARIRLQREAAQTLQLLVAPASARSLSVFRLVCALLALAVYCWLCASDLVVLSTRAGRGGILRRRRERQTRRDLVLGLRDVRLAACRARRRNCVWFNICVTRMRPLLNCTCR